MGWGPLSALGTSRLLWPILIHGGSQIPPPDQLTLLLLSSHFVYRHVGNALHIELLYQFQQ